MLDIQQRFPEQMSYCIDYLQLVNKEIVSKYYSNNIFKCFCYNTKSKEFVSIPVCWRDRCLALDLRVQWWWSLYRSYFFGFQIKNICMLEILSQAEF